MNFTIGNFYFFLMMLITSGCSKNWSNNEILDDWQLVLQAQSSFLNNDRNASIPLRHHDN
jgi:hypothetical protein